MPTISLIPSEIPSKYPSLSPVSASEYTPVYSVADPLSSTSYIGATNSGIAKNAIDGTTNKVSAYAKSPCLQKHIQDLL